MAKKKERGNGTGTVYPRKNKQGKIIGYRGSYFAPDGKRRYVSAKRKGDAEKALRQAMTDADRGLVLEGGTFTIEDYLTRWLTDSVKDTVRSTTFERYEQIARKHIIPEVGRLKLKALTPRARARSVQGETRVGAFATHGAIHPRHAPQGAQAGGNGRLDPAQCNGSCEAATNQKGRDAPVDAPAGQDSA
jgi:hypothetical protein